VTRMLFSITRRLRIRWNGLILGETYTQSWYELTGDGWERRSRVFVHKGKKIVFPYKADALQLETGASATAWAES